jgi:hypothetical protein
VEDHNADIDQRTGTPALKKSPAPSSGDHALMPDLARSATPTLRCSSPAKSARTRSSSRDLDEIQLCDRTAGVDRRETKFVGRASYRASARPQRHAVSSALDFTFTAAADRDVEDDDMTRDKQSATPVETVAATACGGRGERAERRYWNRSGADGIRAFNCRAGRSIWFVPFGCRRCRGIQARSA